MLLDLFKAVVHLQRPLYIFGDLEEALGGQPLKFETMRKGQKGLIARSRSTATEQTKKEEVGKERKGSPIAEACNEHANTRTRTVFGKGTWMRLVCISIEG